MAHVIDPHGVDLGDITNPDLLTYYRREPGYTVGGVTTPANPARSTADVLPVWAANTIYVAGQEILDPTGVTILVRKTTGTSGTTYDTNEQAQWAAGGGGSAVTLTPTAVKTANYTAAAGDLVPVDTTSGNVTVTLPTAPADKTQIGVKHVIRGGTNTVTIAAGGSDVFNKTGGSTTATLTLLNQGTVLQYKASGAIWYVVSIDLPLSQLDARFAATGSSGYGVVGKGFSIPKGSLDVWDAARAAHASQLSEVVAFGDSLIVGQVYNGSTEYSWLTRVRERSIAAGFTDGGRGYYWSAADLPADLFLPGDAAPAVLSRTGFADPGDAVNLPNAFISSTNGDAITFQVKTGRARLWWARYTLGGRFSYSVNGAAAVTVPAGSLESPPLTITPGLFSLDCVLLTAADGLVDGSVNTITVTNLGGAPQGPPTGLQLGLQNNGGSTLTVPATYYYKVSYYNSAGPGETLPSTTVSASTAGGNNTITVNLSPPAAGGSGSPFPSAATAYRVYRSTSAGGPFQWIADSAPVGGAKSLNMADPGLTPNPAITPVGASTYGLDTTFKSVHVVVDAIRANGIVYHNHGVVGTTFGTFFSPDDAAGNMYPATMMGIQWGTGSNGIVQYTAVDELGSAAVSGTDSPQRRTSARVPKLVIFALGTNDILQLSDTTAPPAAPTVTDGGAGIGSGLAAATYYYKVARLTSLGSVLSPATAGTAIAAGHQAIVTAPTPGWIGSGVPLFRVYRSTSAGGTYQYVGDAVGNGGVFIDNVGTPGANASGTTQSLTQESNVSAIMQQVGHAIRIARNSGADVLIVLPAIGSGSQNRLFGAFVKQAIRDVADAFSCAWVDFDVALGPYAGRGALGYAGGNGNVHLTKAAYQAEGDFVWNNVLGPAAPR